MKIFIVCVVALVSMMLITASPKNVKPVSAQDVRKLPDVLTLAADAKLGQVKFSHTDHVTKNRSIEGAVMTCIECHHTAQPAAEAAKHPPLKTVWPADRTTTLTAELAAKDANAVGALCRDCHAKTDAKPKLLPQNPTIKLEVGTELVTLNNQQAFHRNCAGCHDEIVKTNKDLNPPTSKKCIACHKRAAA